MSRNFWEMRDLRRGLLEKRRKEGETRLQGKAACITWGRCLHRGAQWRDLLQPGILQVLLSKLAVLQVSGETPAVWKLSLNSPTQTEMRKSDGGGMRSKCISPYGGNKKSYHRNYPQWEERADCRDFVMILFSCSEMPRHCERCDDFCAKKDGKRNRNSYKEKLKLPKETKDVYVERIKKGYCKYNCRGWPYSSCLVLTRPGAQ